MLLLIQTDIMQKIRLDEQMRKAESKNKHGETRLYALQRWIKQKSFGNDQSNDQSNDQQNAAHYFQDIQSRDRKDLKNGKRYGKKVLKLV